LVLSSLFTDCRLRCRGSDRDFRGDFNEAPEAFFPTIFLAGKYLQKFNGNSTYANKKENMQKYPKKSLTFLNGKV
jgi:hypothetical protein